MSSQYISSYSSKDCVFFYLYRFRIPLRHFKIIIDIGRSPWTGDQPVIRPLLSQVAQHRNTKTNIHALSEILTHDLSAQAIKAFASDRMATETSNVLSPLIPYAIKSVKRGFNKRASFKECIPRVERRFYIIQFACSIIKMHLVLYPWDNFSL
jgi:hypothetical protein